MRPDPRVGTDVGPYRIERVLGRGGMGVVYLAEQPSLGRKVALKVIAPEFSDEPRTKARFLRESRMAAAIDHPNILPIHEAGEFDGVLFIAMRYVEGEDLARLLAGGPLSPRGAVAILAQVAAALDAAHARGLIHRDVKPANILLDSHAGPDGSHHAYLTDFGLTKRGGSEGSLTAVGGFAGTLAYIAPEQVEGRDVDGRADQYSLACMAFECLSGRVPFVRDTDIAVAMAHLRDPVPSVVQLRPDLPSEVDVVLARGIAKDREERYATCVAFVADLRTALDLSPTRPTVPGVKATRRSPIQRAAAIGALVVIVVAAAAFVLGGGAGSASPPSTGPTSAASKLADSPASSSPASSTATPISQPGAFSPTGELIEARFGHTATSLQTGQVLLAGGQGIQSGASAELYDPTNGTSTATGPMQVTRSAHTATRLPDGRVLLVGGSSSSGDFFASAELYDPTSGTFTTTGAMAAARVGHTATLLTDGRILIAGGSGVAGGFFASAELYDPAAGNFTMTGPLSTARGGHSATLLPDGRVLIVGGNDASDVLASAELYDPTSGTFAPAGAMKVARVGHTATLLPARVVLIAGGGIEDALDSAETYDPASGTFSPAGLLTVPRSGHVATILPSGWVLLAGGWTGNALDTDYLSSAELYDPTRGFGPTGAMAEARLMPAATLLPNGRILITGGLNLEGAIASAELFEAPPAP